MYMQTLPYYAVGVRTMVVSLLLCFFQKEARHWARLLSILSFHNASVSLLADPWLTHFVLPNNSFITSENVVVMFKSTKIIAAAMDTRLQSTLVEDQEGG